MPEGEVDEAEPVPDRRVAVVHQPGVLEHHPGELVALLAVVDGGEVHHRGDVLLVELEGAAGGVLGLVEPPGGEEHVHEGVEHARRLGGLRHPGARVGLAGPILGSIGSAACILVWHATGNDLWRALAFTGFFLNLFNLLPVVPLDGGRAMAAMAPWMWFVGFAALIPLAVLFPNPVILLILVFAGFETHKRWKLRRSGDPGQQAYYRVRPLDRALVAGVYLSLVALLVVGMHATALTRTIN